MRSREEIEKWFNAYEKQIGMCMPTERWTLEVLLDIRDQLSEVMKEGIPTYETVTYHSEGEKKKDGCD